MRVFIVLSLVWLVSCSPPHSVPQNVEGFEFTHGIRVVKGAVWGYKQNGEILRYHYAPVGLNRDTNTYTLTARKSDFDVKKAADVRSLISAARLYCHSIGHLHGEGGIGIMEEDGNLILPDFCVPPDALPSLGGKIGDRVPR